MVLVSYYKGFKLLHTAFKDLGVVHLGMLCPPLVFKTQVIPACTRGLQGQRVLMLLGALRALGLESDGIFIESFRGWGVQ